MMSVTEGKIGMLIQSTIQASYYTKGKVYEIKSIKDRLFQIINDKGLLWWVDPEYFVPAVSDGWRTL